MPKKVEIIGDKDCPFCQSAVSFAKENKVKFKFKNVYSKEGMKIANGLNADSIPIVRVCDYKRGKKKPIKCDAIVGFDPKGMKELIGL